MRVPCNYCASRVPIAYSRITGLDHSRIPKHVSGSGRAPIMQALDPLPQSICKVLGFIEVVLETD